jgi:hypothetical protein
MTAPRLGWTRCWRRSETSNANEMDTGDFFFRWFVWQGSCSVLPLLACQVVGTEARHGPKPRCQKCAAHRDLPHGAGRRLGGPERRLGGPASPSPRPRSGLQYPADETPRPPGTVAAGARLGLGTPDTPAGRAVAVWPRNWRSAAATACSGTLCFPAVRVAVAVAVAAAAPPRNWGTIWAATQRDRRPQRRRQWCFRRHSCCRR